MTRRERWILTGLQVITVLVVATLLIFSVVTSQNLAASRQRQSLQAAERNRQLLTSLDNIVRDIRAAQVNQRRAFQKLARRNEQLHGRDPSEAPRFDPLPSLAEPADEPAEEEPRGRRNQPDPPNRPPRRPDRGTPEPRPEPEPTLCAPVLDVCLGGE